MSSITQLRNAASARHIESAVALALVKTLHRHLELDAVLRALWDDGVPLTNASGLRYRNGEQRIEVRFGAGEHSASYNLTDHGDAPGELTFDLGELTFYFERRIDQHTLAVAEDLTALAMPSIRNALRYHALGLGAPTAAPAAARADDDASAPATVRVAAALPGATPDCEDALVLVRLDGFEEVRERHGAAWARTLVETTHRQIHEGLRDADSVFRIDEDLLAVLLPRTSEKAAIDVAAKIRVLIAGLHLRDGRVSNQLTACMGVAGARQTADPEEVLGYAHSALARARREGVNTIRAFHLEAIAGSTGAIAGSTGAIA